jgi:hypothetical protein
MLALTYYATHLHTPEVFINVYFLLPLVCCKVSRSDFTVQHVLCLLLLPLQLLLVDVSVGVGADANPLPPLQHGLHACDLSLPRPTSTVHIKICFIFTVMNRQL